MWNVKGKFVILGGTAGKPPWEDDQVTLSKEAKEVRELTIQVLRKKKVPGRWPRKYKITELGIHLFERQQGSLYNW